MWMCGSMYSATTRNSESRTDPCHGEDTAFARFGNCPAIIIPSFITRKPRERRAWPGRCGYHNVWGRTGRSRSRATQRLIVDGPLDGDGDFPVGKHLARQLGRAGGVVEP